MGQRMGPGEPIALQVLSVAMVLLVAVLAFFPRRRSATPGFALLGNCPRCMAYDALAVLSKLNHPSHTAYDREAIARQSLDAIGTSALDLCNGCRATALEQIEPPAHISRP